MGRSGGYGTIMAEAAGRCRPPVLGVGFRMVGFGGSIERPVGSPAYASEPGSPQSQARLGSGCWPALPGGLCPTGSQREVSV